MTSFRQTENCFHQYLLSSVLNNEACDDTWDSDHVQMPCSPNNLMSDGTSRWSKICAMLTALKQACELKTVSLEHLKLVLTSYSQRIIKIECLEQLLNQEYTSNERARFLTVVLPNIIELVLHVQSICRQTPILLKANTNRAITMSQKQCASLLACAFLCVYPNRRKNTNYQSINFDVLFQKDTHMHITKKKVEKLKCLLHYFSRITQNMPDGVVTFRRSCLSMSMIPVWDQSTKPLATLHLPELGKIEDMKGYVQVDFVNKYIGGTVLQNGCVQEVIRFVICPEMIIALLLCEELTDNENVSATGCERFCSYGGDADTFYYNGDYVDQTVKDHLGQRTCQVVIVNTNHFQHVAIEYQTDNIERELANSYCAFASLGKGIRYGVKGVTTAKKRCEVFHGSQELKALIQLIAASEVQCDMIYFALDDPLFRTKFLDVYNHILKNKLCVKDVHHLTVQYGELREKPKMPLFDFIVKSNINTVIRIQQTRDLPFTVDHGVSLHHELLDNVATNEFVQDTKRKRVTISNDRIYEESMNLQDPIKIYYNQPQNFKGERQRFSPLQSLRRKKKSNTIVQNNLRLPVTMTISPSSVQTNINSKISRTCDTRMVISDDFDDMSMDRENDSFRSEKNENDTADNSSGNSPEDIDQSQNLFDLSSITIGTSTKKEFNHTLALTYEFELTEIDLSKLSNIRNHLKIPNKVSKIQKQQHENTSANNNKHRVNVEYFYVLLPYLKKFNPYCGLCIQQRYFGKRSMPHDLLLKCLLTCNGRPNCKFRCSLAVQNSGQCTIICANNEINHSKKQRICRPIRAPIRNVLKDKFKAGATVKNVHDQYASERTLSEKSSFNYDLIGTSQKIFKKIKAEAMNSVDQNRKNS